MKNQLYLLFTCFVLTLLFGNFKCYKEKDILQMVEIKNNSNLDIYFIPSYVEIDTTLGFTSKETIVANETRLLVKSNTQGRITRPICSEENFNSLNTNKIHVFCVDKKIFDNTKWEIIKMNSMVLKRYDLSLQDLINSNCTLSYP